MQIEGKQVPSGRVRVSGAKNAATRLMAASMLTDETINLLNFPTQLLDVQYKARFIELMGGKVSLDSTACLASFNCSGLKPQELEDYKFPIRTTYLLAAGQLVREGNAYIPYPGGCNIGSRKYDLHVMIWQSLGCQVEEKSDHIRVSGQLVGGDIHFPISTVGGTENAILCAVIARGTTRIYNAYVTPEIENLINLLILMGAQISVSGTSLIEIQGVRQLRGATIPIISDRIEALTWIILSAISGGDVLVENVPFDLMEIPLVYLRRIGLDFFQNSNSVWVSPQSIAPSGLQPFEVACGTHPGIISDMQPFYVLLALYAKGRSLIVDYRYPERTTYLEELSKFYHNCISWDSGKIIVNGCQRSGSAVATSTDLRGSMALVIAAIINHGPSQVRKVNMALRGYDQLQTKLEGLGIVHSINKDDE